jgi:hypothetical protein
MWGPNFERIRAISHDEYGRMGQMGINKAAGSKSIAGGTFGGRVVNRTVGRGHEQICVPVNVMVSEL